MKKKKKNFKMTFKETLNYLQELDLKSKKKEKEKRDKTMKKNNIPINKEPIEKYYFKFFTCSCSTIWLFEKWK